MTLEPAAELAAAILRTVYSTRTLSPMTNTLMPLLSSWIVTGQRLVLAASLSLLPPSSAAGALGGGGFSSIQ